MKRFFVTPCDDDAGTGSGRTWDICERGQRGDAPRCVRSGIRTRIAARQQCNDLNEGKETP